MNPMLVDSWKKSSEKTFQCNDVDKNRSRNTLGKHESYPIKHRCPQNFFTTKELGVCVGSSSTDGFIKEFKTVYENTCQDIFLKGEYLDVLIHGMASIHNQSVVSKNIVVSAKVGQSWETYFQDVAFSFMTSFLKKFSLNSIRNLTPDMFLKFFGLGLGLEHSFRHHSLLEQVSNSYQCPAEIFLLLKEKVPKIETLKGIPIESYDIMISPWATSKEDEEYFKETLDRFEELIDYDPIVAKLMTFLVIFSPQQEGISHEESVELKQYQSKLTMIIYNHLLSKPGFDNTKALDRLSKFGFIIQKLRKCAEIFKTRMISPCGLDFQCDPQDLNSIDMCPL